ncbi:MAG: GGDEF domain-containing protein [Lachnospiraceae bacterium]|nr:GGDEF domain-containing protein [Lachnospiraceae bacterium]
MNSIGKKYLIIVKLILVIVLASFIFVAMSFIDQKYEYPVIDLNDGWTVIDGDEVREDVNIHDIDVGIRKDGNVLILTHELPHERIHTPAIYLRSGLCALTVTIDGGMIYTYGKDYAQNGKLIPKKANYIPLPEQFGGKTVRIIINYSEDNIHSALSNVYLGNRAELVRYVIGTKRGVLVLSVFLAVFGICLILLSPYLLLYGNNDLGIAICGLMAFMMGYYALCYYDLLLMFSDNLEMSTVGEYVSVYMVSVLILVFLYTVQRDRLKRVTAVLACANILVVAVLIVLHVLNILHINMVIRYIQGFSIIQSFYVLYVAVKTFRQNRMEELHDAALWLSDNCLLAGMVVFVVSALADVLKYVIIAALNSNRRIYNFSFVTYGALVFVIAMVMNYFFHTISHYNADDVRKKLMGVAYTDPLTRISNRARSEMELVRLEQDKNEYVIINIDLDHLKEINDTKGHLEGDRLLRGFANELSNAFYDAKIVGRMGGDEFIVIMGSIRWNTLEKRLESFQEELKGKYDFSYGFAKNSEVKGTTAHEVFLMADSRMYMMKEIHHEGGKV